MSFAAPALLAALALLLPVALAFLVRRSREVVRVPSTMLYRLAGAPTARSRRFRRIKQLAALLACLAAVGALVLAAARPQGSTRGETVVFVVDVSASMAAGGRSSPLERARKHVARSIAGGGAGDFYAVIAAGAAPVRLAGPCPPGAALDQAIETIAPERGRGDVEAAVELAASLVAGNPSARIVVLGDSGESAGGVVAVREVPVFHRDFVTEARDNLGVAAFATRPAADARDDEREALLTVATSSDRSRSARVVVSADGREIVERRVQVPAHGEAEIRVRVLASIERLTARVRPDDGARDAIAADDEATILGAARRAPRVVLVAPGGNDGPLSFFADKALASAGAKEVLRLRPDLAGYEARPDDVFVVLGEAPATRIDAPALYLGTHVGALPYAKVEHVAGEATRLRSMEPRDPLLRGVSFEGVTIEHAIAATPPSGARALVELDGGAVMLAGGAGRAAWAYLGIDASKSDLVLRVAFPVLIANALHVLGGASDVLVADTVARSEIALRPSAIASLAAEEPAPHLRLPLRPVLLLALIGAALLAFEAWAWRKGWAS